MIDFCIWEDHWQLVWALYLLHPLDQCFCQQRQHLEPVFTQCPCMAVFCFSALSFCMTHKESFTEQKIIQIIPCTSLIQSTRKFFFSISFFSARTRELFHLKFDQFLSFIQIHFIDFIEPSLSTWTHWTSSFDSLAFSLDKAIDDDKLNHLKFLIVYI